MILARQKPSVKPVFAPALPPQRLLSLDVFRGLVIVAMLLVNNVGDSAAVGFFWKHVNWIEGSQAQAYAQWWAAPRHTAAVSAWLDWAGRFPLLRHCTLADYVMPWFMLIIGVALPFAVAARAEREDSAVRVWSGVLRRSAMLVLLGWAIGVSLTVLRWRYDPNPNAPLTFTLGMDVLQLLGVAYLVARVLYLLPLTPRMVLAVIMFIGHWAILRFYPQGDVPHGTFTAEHEAIGYIYRTWPVFQAIPLVPGRASLSLIGMLSVVPAAATMLLGTWIGQWLMRDDVDRRGKVRGLLSAGAVTAVIGFLWAFDLPFNKPRWTPAYLLWSSGVGAMVLAVIYWLVEVRQSRGWTRFFVVFGLNSIAVYWLSIMTKIWTINMIRVEGSNGEPVMLSTRLIQTLQQSLGSPALGSWAFTAMFMGWWWLVLEVAYRRKIFWKI